MKVLIADDVSTTRKALEKFVHAMKLESILARDGIEAFDRLLEDDSPEMALLDWNMPYMTGAEVCQKIRKKNKPVQPYLILLTQRGENEDVIEGLESGADDYVVKPCNYRVLAARIHVGMRVLMLQKTLAQRIKEVENALAHIKEFQELIPICNECKKIRKDDISWMRLETYISQHAESNFNLGICPECLTKNLAQRKDNIETRQR